MPEESTGTPVNEPVAQSQGLTESEVEGLVTRVLDAKLAPLSEKMGKLDSIDLDTFRSGLLDDVRGIVTENRAQGVDEEGLLKKVGGLLDSKLATIGVKPQRAPGWLGRWLAGS